MADPVRPVAGVGWRPRRLAITPNVRALGVVSLLNDASTEMVYPLLPLFLTQWALPRESSRRP